MTASGRGHREALALLMSATMTYMAVTEKLPKREVEMKEEEDGFKSCAHLFLNICAMNQVVTTRLEQEKFRTFGS